MKRTSLVTAIGAAAISLVSGCAYNLRGTDSENALLERQQRDIAQRYFLPEHHRLLLSIPAHYAELPYDWAVGAAQTSSLDALLGGYGYEPSIVYNIQKKGVIAPEVMAHELYHQLHGRASEHEDYTGIDTEAFISALRQMANDTQATRNIVGEIIHRTAAFRHASLGLSPEKELEETAAFMLQRIVKEPAAIPDYMKAVFRPVLNELALDPQLAQR